MLGLALSVGTPGTLLLGAEAVLAADATALNRLPTTTETTPLPSVGSNRSTTATVAYHTVSAGETLWDIARAHQVSVEVIRDLNGLETTEDTEPRIQVGQVLKVPRPAAAMAALAPAATEVLVVAPEAPAPSLEAAAPTPEVVAPEAPAPSLEAAAPTPEMVTPFSSQSPGGAAPAARPEDEGTARAALDSANPEIAAPSASASTPLVSGVETAPLPQLALGPRQAPDAYRPESFALPEATAPIRYQVQRGDTLAAIARRHGLSLEALVEANRISNPNWIRVGQSLVIPGGVPDSAEATVARTPSPTPVTREVAPTQVAATTPVRVLSDPARPETSGAAEPAVADPFVGNLLASVEVARAQREASVESAPGAIAVPTTAAGPATPATAAPVLLASSPGIAEPAAEAEETLLSSTQIASSPSTTETTTLSASRQRELLAAAPLGSEAYAPINRTPVGQIVSPGMPMLPDTSEYLPDAPARFAGYVWPSQGVLTSGFGWRWGRRHQGIDIAGPVGTPIVAAADGVVERSGWNSGGYGNMVDIRHPDGSLTRYAHNSRNHVRVGQQVRQGQLIADMGSTGRSTGPHVHFEIHLPGSGPVNPVAHLPRR